MTPICLSPEKVEVITLASCVLHNYLRSHNIPQSVYMPPHSIDMEDPMTHEVQLASWRKELSNGLQPLHRQGSNCSSAAKTIGDTMCQYFCTKEGEVSWQYNVI